MKKRMLALFGAVVMLLAIQSASSSKDYEEIELSGANDSPKLDPSSFLMQLEMIETLYKFEGEYITEHQMEDIIASADTTQTCDNTYCEYTGLDTTIIWNSTFETEPEAQSALSTTYNKEANKTVRSQARLLMKALKNAIEYLSENANSIRNEDICHLKNLKILLDESLNDGTLYRYDYETNTVYISFENCMMEFMDKNDSIERNGGERTDTWNLQDYFDKLMIQILNNVRATVCDCRKEKGQTYTSIDEGNNLSFMFDAAIESQIRNSDKFSNAMHINYAYSYTEARKKETLMFLLAVFKENRNVDAYYKAVNDSDLKGLYNFFGMASEEDLYEFYKIGYAFNTYEGNTALSDHIDGLGWYAPISCSYAYLDEVGLTHLAEIMKIATEDLIKIVTPETFTLEEALYLYDFAKGHIAATAEYDLVPRNEKGIIDYPQYFIDTMHDIEDVYYDFLCTIYNIDEGTLRERRAAINMTYGVFFAGKTESNIDSQKLLGMFPLLSTIQGSHFSTSSNAFWFDEDAKKISDYRNEKQKQLEPTTNSTQN